MAAQTPELQSFYLQAQINREISESVQLSEEVAVLYVEIEESITLSEETDLTAFHRREISETVYFSEQAEPLSVLTPRLFSFYLKAKFEREISESIWLSEEIDVLFAEIQESFVFSEVIDPKATHRREINETVLLSEEVEAKVASKTPKLFSFWLNSTESITREFFYLSEDIEIWTDGVLSVPESVRFSEQTEKYHVVPVFEEIVFDEILWMRQALVEELVFSEEVVFEITRLIQESVPLLEELLSNPYTLEEIIEFSETVIRSFPIPEISEEVELNEIVSPYTSLPLEEQLNFQEDLELQILKLNSESIDFSEVTYQSRLSLDETFDLTEQAPSSKVVNLSESFSFEEKVVRQVEIYETINFEEEFWHNHRRIYELFRLREDIDLYLPVHRRYVIEHVKLREDVEWEWKLKPETFSLSEVIYQSRLSLDEALNLTEQTRSIVVINLSESFVLTEDLLLFDIYETITLEEELTNNHPRPTDQFYLQEELYFPQRRKSVSEQFGLSENLELEIYIWIPFVTELRIRESFVLREEEVETSIQPGRIVSEEIFFSEEIELARKIKPLGGGADRGIVAAPKPVKVEAIPAPAIAPKPVEAVSYPTIKVPLAAKPSYPTAKAPPVVERAYPSAEAIPLPRRGPPAVAPEVIVAVPAPPEVRVERRKTRVVRMRITDNTSRYEVR